MGACLKYLNEFKGTIVDYSDFIEILNNKILLFEKKHNISVLSKSVDKSNFYGITKFRNMFFLLLIKDLSLFKK